MTHKPKRRSLLFVPAIRPRFLMRALGGEADTLILDLEDSVAGAAKEEARQNLRAWWPAAYDGPQELALRINPPDSPYYAGDIALLSTLRPHSVVLPKAEAPDQVAALSAQLDEMMPAARHPMEIIPMIETLQGLDQLRDILIASPRVTALLVGAEDLVSEMGVARGSSGREPLAKPRADPGGPGLPRTSCAGPRPHPSRLWQRGTPARARGGGCLSQEAELPRPVGHSSHATAGAESRFRHHATRRSPGPGVSWPSLRISSARARPWWCRAEKWRTCRRYRRSRPSCAMPKSTALEHDP